MTSRIDMNFSQLFSIFRNSALALLIFAGSSGVAYGQASKNYIVVYKKDIVFQGEPVNLKDKGT